MTHNVNFKQPAWPLVKAEPGTVIHGTHDPRALLKAFADELARLASFNPRSPQFGPWCALSAEAKIHLQTPDSAPNWGEDASEMLADLIDSLNDFAPAGHTFGAHEGDGSDYGFWPTE